jgi:hypothetical protein
MIESRLEHNQLKIRQLIEQYRGGKIVIPEFQREYVCSKTYRVALQTVSYFITLVVVKLGRCSGT